MKKATNKARARSKTKALAQKRKRQVNPFLDLLKNMGEDQVAMLRQIVQNELGVDSEIFGPGDPVDLFEDYLDDCALGNVDDDDRAQFIEELVVGLDSLKMDSNGGIREAREKIQAIYDLLDQAIKGHSLHPTDMMMTGKILADAGWDVPDSLKKAMADALQAPPPDTQVAGSDIVSSLLQVADQTGQNPFDVYEYVNSLLAGFPSEAGVMLLPAMIAGKKAVINQAVAGFMSHPDAVFAQTAAEVLAASAKQTPVESSQIERLVRMRPWLPQTRQGHLDATVRAMRSNALPPVKAETPKVIKCYVSVCDGTGTRSLFVTLRIDGGYQIATVMMKLSGVAEAMVLPQMPKYQMDNIVGEMKSSMPTMETDLAGVTRMLQLAIADNFTTGTLPPFKLVEVVEKLGLGPIHPDHASPMDIISNLLAGLPPEQTNQTAMARANADILDNEFKYQWFEAGAVLEDSLYSVKGFKQRVAKLMKTYLPERRQFWARQCAISALVMHGDENARHAPWKQLALVGREIASDVPLDQIPLMKQVAEVSVQVFENRQ